MITCEPYPMPTNWYARDRSFPRPRNTMLTVLEHGGLLVNPSMYRSIGFMAWRGFVDQFGAGR